MEYPAACDKVKNRVLPTCSNTLGLVSFENPPSWHSHIWSGWKIGNSTCSWAFNLEKSDPIASVEAGL